MIAGVLVLALVLTPILIPASVTVVHPVATLPARLPIRPVFARSLRGRQTNANFVDDNSRSRRYCWAQRDSV